MMFFLSKIAALTYLLISTSYADDGTHDTGRSLQSELPMLRAKDQYWVRANDEARVNLKGTNLGNWLLHEFWMMGQSYDGVHDQCSLEAKLDERFGYAEKERLIKLFRDNWISQRDWDFLAGFGFNMVRLPLLWSVMEDEKNPYKLRADAWDYVDWAIDEAAKRGMYTILDMHGVVGGQTIHDHSGCAYKNQYWHNTEYQKRTVWLWEEIAKRYKNNPNVAAYGLLNEPWGSSAQNCVDRVTELYWAVRQIDPNHIIILHGWHNDISAFGMPTEQGMNNVAFELHPYPGLFGDRPNDDPWDVHSDWLRCGQDGKSGVCEVDEIMRTVNAPLLMGEFQPWQGIGLDQGGKFARATYDTYAYYGWAAASWSYKLTTIGGGNGVGHWGMLTNAKSGLLVNANTWQCSGWDTSFAKACSRNTDSIKMDFDGTRTFYLVLKAGSLKGNLDIVFNDVSLTKDDGTREEMIVNGHFESSDGWTEVVVNGTLSYDYDFAASRPSGGQGNSLRISSPQTASGGLTNGLIYQPVTLQGGQRYTLTGYFKDNGRSDAWAEVYMVENMPQAGVDVRDYPNKAVDFSQDPLEDIEALFEYFGSCEYEINDGLQYWMTTNENNDVFPALPPTVPVEAPVPTVPSPTPGLPPPPTSSPTDSVSAPTIVTPNTPNPTPLTPTRPSPSPTRFSNESFSLPLLRAKDQYWVRANDEARVNLKGTNLGNWLLHEFWMMGQSYDGVHDQCSLEAKLDERFGYAEKERLIKLFRDNWISQRDWDFLAGFGFNMVRLPLLWSVMEDEKNPYKLRADAWDYVDWAIDEAAKRGMYTILDMHGVVGGQTIHDHSGCAYKNQYWHNTEYQKRTVWLWEEIAKRYKNNPNVAAYGLLNEPWGSSAQNCVDRVTELYWAVRQIDPNHIIILHGWHNDISAFGMPTEQGMNNVAFELHPYPGLFGDRPNDDPWDVHSDWLRCGQDGKSGVCEVDEIMRTVNAPLLMGEFQPWQGIGLDQGGKFARATYDTYAYYGWAAASWSYKLTTIGGGNGVGHWGMLTNAKSGLLVNANTWQCSGWDTSFAKACSRNTDSIKMDFDGTRTFYLVLKAGSLKGNLDIVFNDISLTKDDGTREEMIVNGHFESSDGWTEVVVNGTLSYDYDFAASRPSGGQGNSLRISSPQTASGGLTNGLIYQPVTLQGGQRYTLTGYFKDNGRSDAWAEVYMVENMPQAGVDVRDYPNKAVDFSQDPLEDIEALFEYFGSCEYEINDGLQYWMTTNENNDVFPALPPTVPVEAPVPTVPSPTPGLPPPPTLQPPVQVPPPSPTSPPTDTPINIPVGPTSLEPTFVIVPATIQAEDYVDMYGVQVEPTTDSGEGTNVGYLEDSSDWFEYAIYVPTSALYTMHYRVASDGGSNGFSLHLDDVELEKVGIPSTGGWQNWITIFSTVPLEAGEHMLRFHSLGNGGWNLNWIKISEPYRSFLPARIEAETFNNMHGISLERTSDDNGGMNIGSLEDTTDWFEYLVTIPHAGNYAISYRVASDGGSHGFSLLLDGTEIDKHSIPSTGGWQNWTTLFSTVVIHKSGDHVLRFKSHGNGGWNLNWFELRSDIGGLPPPPSSPPSTRRRMYLRPTL